MFETANDHCASTKKGEDSYICITKPMTNVLMRGSSHPWIVMNPEEMHLERKAAD